MPTLAQCLDAASDPAAAVDPLAVAVTPSSQGPARPPLAPTSRANVDTAIEAAAAASALLATGENTKARQPPTLSTSRGQGRRRAAAAAAAEGKRELGGLDLVWAAAENGGAQTPKADRDRAARGNQPVTAFEIPPRRPDLPLCRYRSCRVGCRWCMGTIDARQTVRLHRIFACWQKVLYDLYRSPPLVGEEMKVRRRSGKVQKVRVIHVGSR